MSESVRLELSFNLEVAHYMTNVDKDHRNHQVHGHSYMGLAIFEGPIHPQTGIMLDYEDLKVKIDAIVYKYDHKLLNDFPGLENPSSENLAKVLYHDILQQFSELKAVRIWRPTLGFNVQYPGSLT